MLTIIKETCSDIFGSYFAKLAIVAFLIVSPIVYLLSMVSASV